jgi:dynein heavy chain
LYINTGDIGWNLKVQSWIESRQSATEKVQLNILFDKYVQICIDMIKKRFKTITPFLEMAHVDTLCNMLDCLFTPKNIPPDSPKEFYEIYFVYACIWSMGSTLFHNEVKYYNIKFIHAKQKPSSY